MKMGMSRRDALLRCAAMGALKVAPWMGVGEAISSLAAQEKDPARKPTPWNEIGPFFKRLAPHHTQLRGTNDPGLPVHVAGQVFDTRGDRLPGATLEIWQADHLGLYDLEGYRYRASLIADGSGKYAFDSVMPGHYPARVCQHIHYIVSAAGHRPLVTQLYFATDPVFEGDPDRNYSRDPLVLSRELVRPVTLTGDPMTVHANVTFEVVLERL
jgi:protocatechuate 3,4-dioxygenase beta subunit